jgi:hypothetical protein
MKHKSKKISQGYYLYRGFRVSILPPNGYNSIRLWEIFEAGVEPDLKSSVKHHSRNNWTHCYTLREGKEAIDRRIEREANA